MVASTDTAESLLAPLPKGRAATEERVKAALGPLCELVIAARAAMNFSPTLRGWRYLIENRGYVTKGEFDALQDRITMARKRGWLPLDITAEDETRQVNGIPEVTDDDPTTHLQQYLDAAVEQFAPHGPNDFRLVYPEIMVEKLDLVSLFSAAAADYGVGILCSRGWSDLHSRAALLRRFQEAADEGQHGVLLVYGDFDPGGLSITENLAANLEELAPAAGCGPEIEIVRVGLNFDDIERLGLTWIDGLETSGGKDLADKTHPQHKNANVQDYLRRYGARKCEANALIVQPDEADRIIREALAKWITDDELTAWRQAQSEARAAIRQVAMQRGAV